jgi:hypothetical protein
LHSRSLLYSVVKVVIYCSIALTAFRWSSLKTIDFSAKFVVLLLALVIIYLLLNPIASFVRTRMEMYSRITRISWIIIALGAGATLVFTIPLSLETFHFMNSRLSWLASLLFDVAPMAITLGFVLLVLSIYCVSRKDEILNNVESREFFWYTIPSVVSWTFYLLVFWPGGITNDSADQWLQATNGPISDHHPAFHTLCIWLITRIWHSPAAVALTQILFLSSVAGWAIITMRRLGLPKWKAALICCIFAFHPAISSMSVILWKDIAYSISILALTTILLKIVHDDSRWMAQSFSWLILGLLASLVSLFRHQGPLIAWITVILLMIIYREYWQHYFLALILALAIWIGIRGPLYSAIHVPSQSVHGSVLMSVLHHLGGYLANGESTELEARKLFENIHPLTRGKWPHNPYWADTLWFSPEMNRHFAFSHKEEILKSFWSLFLVRPTVALKNQIVLASYLWSIRFPPNAPYSSVPLSVNGDGEAQSIQVSKDIEDLLGLHNCPPFPQFSKIFMRLLPFNHSATGSSWWSCLIWRPAFYFYVLIISAAIASMRSKKWPYMLVCLPVLINWVSMIIFPMSQELRFQYSTLLSSILFSGFFLVLPADYDRETS